MVREDYRIEVRGPHFFVYKKSPRTVLETTFKDGEVTTQERRYTDVFRTLSSDPDIFNAWYDRGRDIWHCDQDCGAQRYRREATTSYLRAGLKRIGMKPEEIKQLFKTVMTGRVGAA